jgi:plasmid stabilization system protein ParE
MAAADDLEGISNYLYLRHPSFAASTIQRLYDAAKSLREFPHVGRAGRKSGTRELVLAQLLLSTSVQSPMRRYVTVPRST